MIELLEITKVNGEREAIPYNNRKTQFKDIDELDAYRKYLKKKLHINPIFIYRQKA